VTDAQKLKKIEAAFETLRYVGKGKKRHSVSNHAYYNLEGAIIDIERTGECDATSLRTIKRVRDQIGKIGQILALYP
jgi:hypothetical protein